MVFSAFGVGIKVSTDAELCVDSDLAGILQGTVKLEQRVTQLFEVLREPVYHYLIAVFGSPAEAEDITQEIFLQLYKALHRGQAIENLRAWIFRVAHNLAINQIKRKQFLDPLDAHSWDELRQMPSLVAADRWTFKTILQHQQGTILPGRQVAQRFVWSFFVVLL